MNGLFFIINPVAGNGRSSKVWGKVKRELDKRKIIYLSFFTECPGHAEVLARQIATIQDYHLKNNHWRRWRRNNSRNCKRFKFI
ncbi:acylglycerol kinase family protein [Metabacillus herbersteinensis]|uniref:Acylglycerol kinase family protein n=1 Tax=Metabacillus herbersteinensis TaxID=283816 RepID=A0ABV6GAC4_9BACI